MKIERLTIDNFLGITFGEVSFDKSGVCFVEGINRDSTTATSNGSGKSSIFEALFWSLYGQTKRGLKGDDVIHKNSKHCEVVVVFSVAQNKYAITRAKNRKGQAHLNLVEYAAGGKVIPLSKGTVKDTQAAIEDIVKISALTFSKMAYFGQSDIKPFASLTDKELKEVFEQALGLTVLTDQQNKIKGFLTGLESVVSSEDRTEQGLKNEIDSLSTKKEYLEKLISEIAEKKKDEHGKLMHNLTQCKSEVEKLKGFIDDTNVQVAGVQSALESIDFKKHKNQMAAFVDYRDKHKEMLSKINFQITNMLSELDKTKEALSSLKPGDVCMTCHREFSESDVSVAGSRYKDSIEEYKKALLNFSATKTKMQKKIVSLSESIKKYDVKVDLARSQYSDRMSLKGKLESEIYSAKRRIDSLLVQISNNEKELDSIDERYSSYEPELKGVVAELEVKEKDLKALEGRRNVILADIKTGKVLEFIFSNSGLKSYICDHITPALNKVINQYMQILDPDIEIEISTIKKLKSGEYRDKFSISVINQNGAAKYEGNSGGEMSKINFAIALAFNNIVRTIAESEINFVFLDEVTESLDSAGIESAFDLIQSIDIDNVFLVTHLKEFGGLVSDKITVVKENGSAFINGRVAISKAA